MTAVKRRTAAEWATIAEEAHRRFSAIEPTAEPDPHRTDHLEIGSPDWAWIGSLGHRCRRCGNACGSTACHEACCGTESSWRLRKPVGSYCTGHPCAACSGTGDRPDAGAVQQLSLFDLAGAA